MTATKDAVLTLLRAQSTRVSAGRIPYKQMCARKLGSPYAAMAVRMGFWKRSRELEEHLAREKGRE